MKFFIRLIACLSLESVRSLGTVLGGLLYRFNRPFRGHLKENLGYAGLYSEDFAKCVAKHIGIQALEAVWVLGRSHEEVIAQTRIDESSYKVFDEVFASGRPVVFLTPHIGCYEVAPMRVEKEWLAGTDRKLAILYRMPKKKYLREIVSKGRASSNIVPAPADLGGVRQIIKILRAGGLVGILPDQLPKNGEGVWASFFGKPAYTMTLPLRLMKQFNAPAMMVRVERERGGWCIFCKVWDYELTGQDCDAEAFNRLIEETILECPEQYLWSYHRYKVPRGVQPLQQSTENAQ